MRYIQNSDYKYSVTENDFETLTYADDNPDLFVYDAQIKAQEMISLNLRKRYDLTALFQTFPAYQAGKTYTTGDTVWYGSGFDAMLYSPTSTTNSLPDSGYWVLTEPRYPLIVQWMVNISLYLLHARMSPQNIPIHRQIAYEETMRTLKGIQQEALSADFPEIEGRNYNIYITGSTSTGIGYQW